MELDKFSGKCFSRVVVESVPDRLLHKTVVKSKNSGIDRVPQGGSIAQFWLQGGLFQGFRRIVITSIPGLGPNQCNF